MLPQLLLWTSNCLFDVHLLEFPCLSVLLQVQLSAVILIDLDLATFAVLRNRPPHRFNGTVLIAAILSHCLPIAIAT